MDTKQWIIAAIVVLVVIIVAYVGYTHWKKTHASGFSAEMPMTVTHRMQKHPMHKKPEGFGGMDWPQADTFGAMADTFPYGNYADGLQMYYPTYDEYAALWTRS